MDVANLHKKSTTLGTTRWERWASDIRARDWILTILPIGICIYKHPSKNEIYKILRHFEIQTDHLISARRPDLVVIKKYHPPQKNNKQTKTQIPTEHKQTNKQTQNKTQTKKKTCCLVDFSVPTNCKVKIKELKHLKNTWTLPENKIPVEVEVDRYSNCS